jgi:hypothetical protein
MRKIVHIANCISSQGLNHTKFQKCLSEMEEHGGSLVQRGKGVEEIFEL